MTELENMIVWAKTACEETRAQVGWPEIEESDFITVPSWLPELEHAIEDYENSL